MDVCPQARESALQLKLFAALAWTVPGILLFGLAGAYSTWRAAGEQGLRAEAVTGAITVAVMLANALFIVWYSRGRSAAKTALIFMASGMVRGLICIGLVLAAYAYLGLPIWPLVIWAVVFYMIGLAGEAAWMSRALRASRPAQTQQGVSPGAVGQ